MRRGYLLAAQSAQSKFDEVHLYGHVVTEASCYILLNADRMAAHHVGYHLSYRVSIEALIFHLEQHLSTQDKLQSAS